MKGARSGGGWGWGMWTIFYWVKPCARHVLHTSLVLQKSSEVGTDIPILQTDWSYERGSDCPGSHMIDGRAWDSKSVPQGSRSPLPPLLSLTVGP